MKDVSVFLLDTDHLGIIQRQTEPEFSRLIGRISQRAERDFFVSIVSFHEEVGGWNAYLNRASSAREIVFAYEMLRDLLADFARMQVVNFDLSCENRFRALRKQRIRIGTMDLRIAAIALEYDFTLLSRNVRDFSRVPGLRIEDWTVT